MTVLTVARFLGELVCLPQQTGVFVGRVDGGLGRGVECVLLAWLQL